MLATATGPARVAFERLLARYAAALRAGSALAAAPVAFVGLAPPASLPVVTVTVTMLVAWAGGYLAVAVTRGWTWWLVPVDVAVAAGLCLGHGRLVPGAVLPDGSSWVFVAASTTVITSQLAPRAALGVLATLLVTAAHVAGLRLAGVAGPSGYSAVLLVQGTLVGALMTILRRSSRAADAAIAEHEAVRRDAAVRAARRAEEREYCRLLHDSVTATLTVVASGGLAAGSVRLRDQAVRDLAVVERLQAPAGGAEVGTLGLLGAAGTDVRLGVAPEVPGAPVAPVAAAGDSTAPAGGAAGLVDWLAPLGVAFGPMPAIEVAIADVAVPAAVGAAIAGAVAEALTNVSRHAATARVQLRAVPAPGGVLVEVVDDGPGFDPSRVPAHRRGLRESVIGRMRAVGGSAAVASRPGAGTRIVLCWPADPAVLAEEVGSAGWVGWLADLTGSGPGAPVGGVTPDHGAPGDPTPGGPTLGDVVASRYRRGFDLAIVWLVGCWCVGADLGTIILARAHYRSMAVELAAAVALAAIGAVGARRLLRHRTEPGVSRLLAFAALAASAAATAALAGPAVLAGNWAWDATGWIGVLLLLRRPLAEIAGLLAANAGLTLAAMLSEGVTDRVSLARFAAVTYATTALQLAVALAARAVDASARRTAAAAEAEAAARRERQVADELHASRQDRYRTVRHSVTPLLAGLARGELDPAEPGTQRRCAVEASRLRRLFAETDDVPDPLVHELRACTDIADRRGVLVDLLVLGRMPELALPTRRALTEAPLHALAGAERHARVTVVGRSDEVSISVLADGRLPNRAELPASIDPAVMVTVQEGEDQQWIEARWRRR